jgi:hypothetical protein
MYIGMGLTITEINLSEKIRKANMQLGGVGGLSCKLMILEKLVSNIILVMEEKNRSVVVHTNVIDFSIQYHIHYNNYNNYKTAYKLTLFSKFCCNCKYVCVVGS